MIDELFGRVDTVGCLFQMNVTLDKGVQTDEFLEPGKELEVPGFRDGVVVECDRSQLLHDLLDSATLRKISIRRSRRDFRSGAWFVACGTMLLGTLPLVGYSWWFNL